MLSELQIIVLALIQGITEFLPISSSAHLILPSQLLGWPDQGLAFDVAVHVGSLLAVLWYFRVDVGRMLLHWSLHLARRPHDASERTLAWWIILATIPAVIFGYLFQDQIETHLRSILVIAITTSLFGAALWWSDVGVAETRTLGQLNWKHTVLIGLAQAIALIPGTSRSGITMTAAMALGYGKKDAARFSFLLSIPLIFAAGVLKTISLIQQPDLVYWNQLFVGTVLSFVSAYACIALFLKWIEQIGFFPFVLYRFVLGGVLFFIYFSL
ncbi:undecaprenyl-diphosphate phosphatase [Saccharospirillum alexandrii]|uniref:undecaprenyl-diphosphate phosphatase n=1 Tax=Saccharospirillum alexandrii TaxID=2448477 RepID=UPI00373677D6